MEEFAELERISLREIWPHEAHNFTPWLAENISKLGSALEFELELVDKEAAVGDFSLDLLAKHLGTSKLVVIENQIAPTDHDHLGKLLTYAAGYDASYVIWVAEKIREEHRQAMDWLNQRTDEGTQFFGVVTEVLRIDGSKPALNFKPVVFPNEWQKAKKSTAQAGNTEKGEKYRQYFQRLIDRLREEHKFTGARIGQPQNWYSFASGTSGFTYGANFALGGKARAEIYIDTGEADHNKAIFDILMRSKERFDLSFGLELDWERLDEKRACRIATYRAGTIESPSSELEEIMDWHIDRLLAFKRVFSADLKAVITSLE